MGCIPPYNIRYEVALVSGQDNYRTIAHGKKRQQHHTAYADCYQVRLAGKLSGLSDESSDIDHYGLDDISGAESRSNQLKKTHASLTQSRLLLQLEQENVRLRSELMRRELSQRQHIERILELEHEVARINSQLADIRNAYYSSDKKSETANQAVSKLQDLEGVSLIQYTQAKPKARDIVQSAATTKGEDRKQAHSLGRIYQLVKEKSGIQRGQEVCSYVRSCIKFAETVKECVQSIRPIKQSDHKKLMKAVWKQLKKIITEWAQVVEYRPSCKDPHRYADNYN